MLTPSQVCCWSVDPSTTPYHSPKFHPTVPILLPYHKNLILRAYQYRAALVYRFLIGQRLYTDRSFIGCSALVTDQSSVITENNRSTTDESALTSAPCTVGLQFVSDETALRTDVYKVFWDGCGWKLKVGSVF